MGPKGQGTSVSSIGIVTIRDDVHALLVSQYLRARYGINVYLIEADYLAGTSGFSWSISNQQDSRCTVLLTGPTGPTRVSLSEIAVVWWRKSPSRQLYPKCVVPEWSKLIDRDCESSLLGSFLTAFHGTCISNPLATTRAGNKLVQLETARKCGFCIPETLISQDPTEILAFKNRWPGGVVVKAVRGVPGVTIFTRMISDFHISKPGSLELVPAIYQRIIEGTRHIRFVCFGTRLWAFELVSTLLDWREDHCAQISEIDLPHTVANQIFSVIGQLDLRMGIGDLKISPEGEYVWLEVNPQGQFLFLQEATGINLAAEFADFLVDAIPPD